MGAAMRIAAIATPADRVGQPDFDAGRRALQTVTDPKEFGFDDHEYKLAKLVDGFDPGVHLHDGEPTLDAALLAGRAIVDSLDEAFGSQEITHIDVAGYTLFLSVGPSGGDLPTHAAEAISNAYRLPRAVLRAMGFIPDHHRPLSRANGNPGHVTDTDVVDAIALGMGTKHEWSGADELEWIANTVARVRPHPGNRDPREYHEDFIAQHGFDPTEDNFLNGYVGQYDLADEDLE